MGGAPPCGWSEETNAIGFPSIFGRSPWFTVVQGRWEELFSGGNFEWPSTERMWELVWVWFPFQFSKQISLEGQLKFNSTLGFVPYSSSFQLFPTEVSIAAGIPRGIVASPRNSPPISPGSWNANATCSGSWGWRRHEGTIGVSSLENHRKSRHTMFFPKKTCGDVVYPRYTCWWHKDVWLKRSNFDSCVGEPRRTTTPASWASSAASPIRKAPCKASDWCFFVLVDRFLKDHFYMGLDYVHFLVHFLVQYGSITKIQSLLGCFERGRHWLDWILHPLDHGGEIWTSGVSWRIWQRSNIKTWIL